MTVELSVIVPVKDERENLPPLVCQVRRALDPLGVEYEIVLVDDGSVDGSYSAIEKLASEDPRVKAIRLWRSFGQTAALQAGIDWSTGPILVTMDGDLQNDPADIPRLLQKMAEEYDAVLGLREERKDTWLGRRLPSALGNGLVRLVTGLPHQDLGCTLRVIRRSLAEALPLYGEMHRLLPVLAYQYGARLAQIPVCHHPRRAGHSKYGLTRTFRVVLDLVTLQFLHRYLTRPMHVMGFIGLASLGLGMVTALAVIWMKWGWGTDMTGNPLLLLSVMLVLLGIQFLSMGLLGELLARTYFESQGKTAYAVRSTLNLERGPKDRSKLPVGCSRLS